MYAAFQLSILKTPDFLRAAFAVDSKLKAGESRAQAWRDAVDLANAKLLFVPLRRTTYELRFLLSENGTWCGFAWTQDDSREKLSFKHSTLIHWGVQFTASQARLAYRRNDAVRAPNEAELARLRAQVLKPTRVQVTEDLAAGLWLCVLGDWLYRSLLTVGAAVEAERELSTTSSIDYDRGAQRGLARLAYLLVRTGCLVTL